MAARPRKPGRKNWPPNLYARDRSGLYYFWRHPQTGKDYSLGRDFNDARITTVYWWFSGSWNVAHAHQQNATFHLCFQRLTATFHE